MGRLSGYTEVQIGDQVRGFKFGTGMYMRISWDLDMDLGQVHEYLKGLDDYNRMITMFFYAAKFACDINGQKVDFTKVNVEEWIDEIPEEDLDSIYKAFSNSKVRGKKLSEMGEEEKKKKAS